MNANQQKALGSLQNKLRTEREITTELQVTGEAHGYVFTEVNRVTVLIGPNGGYKVPSVRTYLKSPDAAVYADEYWAKQDNHPATARDFITGHLGRSVGTDLRCDDKNCRCQTETDNRRRDRALR